MEKDIENVSKYDDIINMKNPEPKNHVRMDRLSRAAQFAPFAALTGYNEAIYETQRITESRVELDEDSKKELDEKLSVIIGEFEQKPEVIIKYFVQDKTKEGGSFRSIYGKIKKVDSYNKIIVMQDDTNISIKDIIEIESSAIKIADNNY